MENKSNWLGNSNSVADNYKNLESIPSLIPKKTQKPKSTQPVLSSPPIISAPPVTETPALSTPPVMPETSAPEECVEIHEPIETSECGECENELLSDIDESNMLMSRVFTRLNAEYDMNSSHSEKVALPSESVPPVSENLQPPPSPNTRMPEPPAPRQIFAAPVAKSPAPNPAPRPWQISAPPTPPAPSRLPKPPAPVSSTLPKPPASAPVKTNELIRRNTLPKPPVPRQMFAPPVAPAPAPITPNLPVPPRRPPCPQQFGREDMPVPPSPGNTPPAAPKQLKPPAICFDEHSEKHGEMIRESIYDELSDYKYYMALARKSRSKSAVTILKRIALEEERHAKRLSTAYYLITGKTYYPVEQVAMPVILSFSDALRKRFRDELSGAEKYITFANETENDPCLYELLKDLAADEERHSREIQNLLTPGR